MNQKPRTEKEFLSRYKPNLRRTIRYVIFFKESGSFYYNRFYNLERAKKFREGYRPKPRIYELKVVV